MKPWREITILALMVMEVSWIVPWYRSLTPATYAVPPERAFLVLLAIFIWTHLIVRLINFLRLKMEIRRIILAIVFAASILFGLKTMLYASESLSFFELLNRPLSAFKDYRALIPDEFVVSLVVLASCWRGLSLAQEYIEPVTVKRNFQLGVFMFIGFVFINTIVTGEAPGFLLYTFFFAGLFAMSTARVSVMGSVRGGGTSPFNRTWLFGVLFSALAVVLLAAVLAGLTVEGGILGRIGSALLGFMVFIAILIVSPVIFLIPGLTRVFPGITESLSSLADRLSALKSNLSGLAQNLFGFLKAPGFLDWIPRLKPVLLWSAVFFVAFLILIGLSRWVLKEREGAKDERQSLLEAGDLLRLLKEALQNRLQRVGEGLAEAAQFRAGQRWLAAARIRRIYSHLMELSAELGKPRQPAQTPLEFLPALVELFPASDLDLESITSAYLRIRYGEFPESREEVDQVEAAWKRVRAAGKLLLQEKKLKNEPRLPGVIHDR